MRLSLSIQVALTVALCVVTHLATALITPVRADEAGWTTITREDGVHVSKKDVPGRDLPTFRGVGTLNASIFDVLLVLDNVDELPKWVHRCVEAEQVKLISPFSRLVYSRTAAPWPVSDRDMVSRTEASVDIKERVVTIRFEAIPGHRPMKKGVVRMKYLKGLYRLEMLSPSRTRVTYQIDADPGGWLPRWVVRLASKSLPLETVRNLRNRVAKIQDPERRARVKAKWLKALKEHTGESLPDL